MVATGPKPAQALARAALKRALAAAADADAGSGEEAAGVRVEGLHPDDERRRGKR